MRWTCTLCLTLLALPAVASAQAEEEEAVEMSSDGGAESGADDGSGAGMAAPADDSPPPSPPPREATQDDPMPPTGTSSVVVDEQADRLRREQEAMVEETEGAAEEDDEGSEDSLDHEFQVGIRGGVGVPFFFGLRYNGGPRCNNSDPMDPDAFCLYVGSTVITFDVSFGVTPDVELVLGGRVGAIGVEPTERNNIQLFLGIRAYISPESIAKVYFSPGLVLDLTEPGAVANWGDVDFGVRGAFGVQVDMLRFLGLYVELGVNILFLRAFGIAPDITGGFQVRFP